MNESPATTVAIQRSPEPAPLPWDWLRIDNPLADFFRKHTAVTIAILSGGLVLLRAASVARYDPDVWRTVLTRSDPTALIFGSLALFIPTILPLLALLLDTARIVRRNRGHSISLALEGALMFSVLGIAVATSVAAVLSTIAGAAAFWLSLRIYRLVKRVRGGDYKVWAPVTTELQQRQWIRSLLVVLIITNVYFIAISRQSWLPTENVSTTSRQYVGYVIGSTGGWTTILKERDRGVVTVADGSITARDVCVLPEVDGYLDLPLFWLVRRMAGEARSVPSCNLDLP